MPKPYPRKFRDDVVAVARKGDAPLNQIAKDFGISESCLANWMKKADVQDGNRPGVTEKQSTELRDAKKRGVAPTMVLGVHCDVIGLRTLTAVSVGACRCKSLVTSLSFDSCWRLNGGQNSAAARSQPPHALTV